MASPDVAKTSVEIIATTLKTRPSMPDSAALRPVKGRNTSKEIVRARLVWNVYSTVHVKFTAPQEHQPIIPIENVGSSNRLASKVPKARRRGHKVMTTMRSPGRRTQEGKRSFPRKLKW